MWFLFSVCQATAKINIPFFTLIQILAIKKPAEAGFFRKLFSAGAEAN
ncbi:hypothetical protein EC12741_2649 [Escherichia coli 1.2741]|nr:hypothetical protein ECSTEC7V_3862 [Escherichia coli STEC_7v]EIG80765.1 hypothetical protein EC12741_2649 [Escherichia coli 1.2741]